MALIWSRRRPLRTSPRRNTRQAARRISNLQRPSSISPLFRGAFCSTPSRRVPAQITIAQAQGITAATATGQRTIVTAGKFEADFTSSQGKNRLTTVHGAPNARIVSSTPGQPDRVSTSESVDAKFLPQGGIESVTQQGNVAYSDQQSPDKRMQASAESARYTPADQMLVLTGSPRVTSGGMATTAKIVRINRATGDDVAEGDVKTTYSELKEQPDGALLASSSPIHVTSSSMTANSSGVALYTGNARLWQDANVIEAPSIQFERDHRFVTAQGTPGHPVQTILVQKEKAAVKPSDNDKKRRNDESASSKQPAANDSSPISITAAQAHLRRLRASSPLRRWRLGQGSRVHRRPLRWPTPT